MGTPTQKRTKSSKKRRASHFALKKTILSRCLKCRKPLLPHRACSFCGIYRGREAVKIRLTKEERKKRKEKKKS